MSTLPPPPRSNRLAPKLFVPPSQNASNTDLTSADISSAYPSLQTPASARAPLLRQLSSRRRAGTDSELQAQQPDLVPAHDPQQQRSTQPETQQNSRRNHRRQASSTSQTWIELQNTLEEVELSSSSGANVFGAEHARALEELRAAQIELARAWARGEEGESEGHTVDEDGMDFSGMDNSHNQEQEPHGIGGRDANGAFGSARGGYKTGVLGGGHARTGSAGNGSGAGAGAGAGAVPGLGKSSAFGISKNQMEEETENDIMLARKRRLANDKYFEKVNKGVLDVVAKLEVVANKMGSVELESQEIWADRSSIDDDSIAS